MRKKNSPTTKPIRHEFPFKSFSRVSYQHFIAFHSNQTLILADHSFILLTVQFAEACLISLSLFWGRNGRMTARSVGGVTMCSLIVLSGFSVCDVLFIAACYRFSHCSLRPQPLADRALWLVKAFQPSRSLALSGSRQLKHKDSLPSSLDQSSFTSSTHPFLIKL